MLDLIVARDIADLGRPDYTLEDVRSDWAAPGIVLARDAWLVRPVWTIERWEKPLRTL